MTFHKTRNCPEKSTAAQRPLWAGLAVIAVSLAAMTGQALAQSPPADREIKAALYDLNRVGPQMGGLTPKRNASIRRIERSLKMAEQRLSSSKNQSDPSWQEAKALLDQYRAQIAALKAPAPAPAATTAPNNATAATPATGSTTQSAPATQSAGATAARPTAQTRAPATSQAQAAAMPSYLLIKYKKWARETGGVASALTKLAPKTLHNPNITRKWGQRFNTLRSNGRQFQPYQGNPEVAAIFTRIESSASSYQAIEKKSLAAYAALGDVPGQVNKIETYYRTVSLPERLEPPYTAERAQAWAQYMRAFASQARNHSAILKNILATTERHKLPVNNALNGTVNSRAGGAIRRAIKDTRTAIYEPLQGVNANSNVVRLSKLSPTDKKQLRNNLLQDGQFETAMSAIRTAEQAIDNGEIINTALAKPQTEKAKQAKTNLNQLSQKLTGLYESVLSEARMPKGKPDNPALLAAAESALARQDPVPTILRMKLNTETTDRKETRAWYNGGGVTFADYIWTEFQVVTAEEIDGKVFLYYNNIHRYSSGSSRTPLNKWIVNSRFQSGRILKESVNK